AIRSVLPENRKLKLNSPKQHNHYSSHLERRVIREFHDHLNRQKVILHQAAGVDLNRVRVKVEILPWLKLRLGDFLPFLLQHQSRHLTQAEEAAGVSST
ncbi:MAG: hypothetical protein LPK45_05620, partial [Bacteroidota bacterium]|nr:hypothetical protein [Bacteroidota bacterium]MDX5430547.1 hypothetical protein [Bacteroidota bacterium]MDX5469299.1 hypothetical protein [Bacteroidota bacterium]